MRFDAAHVQGLAKRTGFDGSNLEKVIRLKQLLIEFHNHAFLRGKLVLKGGTAINLFYLTLARLSVDLDLNYVGELDREKMQEQRAEIEKSVEQVSLALGYKVQRGINEHALTEWYLGYQNHARTFDQIQVEINFLMRVCAIPPILLPAIPIADDDESCKFFILSVEELFAGKIKALIQRQHPRDLYDLYRFVRTGVAHQDDLLRKLTVLFCSTMDRDFRTYDLKRAAKSTAQDVERLLYPLLKAGDRPTGPEMFASAEPILQNVLDHSRENAFLQQMATGQYAPELLFPEHPDIVERIRAHPALLWKATNVAAYLSKQKRPMGRNAR